MLSVYNYILPSTVDVYSHNFSLFMHSPQWPTSLVQIASIIVLFVCHLLMLWLPAIFSANTERCLGKREFWVWKWYVLVHFEVQVSVFACYSTT